MHAGHAWQELQGHLRQLQASEAPECLDDFVHTVLEAADECATIVKAGEKAVAAGKLGAAAAQVSALKKEIRRVYDELTKCQEDEPISLARLKAIADDVCNFVAAAAALRDRFWHDLAPEASSDQRPAEPAEGEPLFEMDS